MKKSILALALITASSAATAQSPNWNKLDVSYLDTDIDVNIGEASFDGFGLNGSVALSDNWMLFGDYKAVSEDANGASADLDMFSAGAGFYQSVSDNTDMFATASVERLEVSGSGGGISASDGETGFGLGVGVRSMLTSSFELGGKVDYVNIDSEDIVRAQVNAFYYFTDNISLGLGYEMYRPSDADLDIDTLSASFRYAF